MVVVVDGLSKFLEVEIMPNVTTETTIEKLRDLFARFGIPERLVSDNGAQFSSCEFTEFTKRNGIKHILVAPYTQDQTGRPRDSFRRLSNF